MTGVDRPQRHWVDVKCSRCREWFAVAATEDKRPARPEETPVCPDCRRDGS